MNFPDRFDFWTSVVRYAKETLVRNEGIGQDIPVTFCAMRDNGQSVMGSCLNAFQRATCVSSFGGSRWLHLCRQVVQLTGADMAFAALECMTYNPETNENDLEGIECSGVNRDDSYLQSQIYTYDAGRQVVWAPPRTRIYAPVRFFTFLEVDAARVAWKGDRPAYPASVKYLSQICNTTWTGDEELLASLRSVVN